MRSRELVGFWGFLSIGLVLSAGVVMAGGAPSAFTEEAVARGLNFTMGPYPQVQGYVGQGAGFVDIDDDGDPDVVVIGDVSGRVGIYENIGGGIFVDRTADSGIPIMQEQEGFAAADYDADGFLDLYITQANNRPNFLMKSNGDFTFVDVTASTGVNNGASTSTGPSWGDYNHDGWPDLYVANEFGNNRLYHNEGDGTFTDRAHASGTEDGGSSMSATWADYDGDGDLDLYLCNIGDFTTETITREADNAFFLGETLPFLEIAKTPDQKVPGEADRLFRNNGDGTFEDITKNRTPPRGLAFLNPGNANGACVGDIDNDGDMDIFLPTADQANRLVISRFSDDGKVHFTDITKTAGIDDFGGARGCAMADFDNDGFLDIYVNNGGESNVLINDVLALPVFVQFYIAWEPAANKLYRNNGDNTFTDVTEDSGAEGIGIGSGVGAADLDDDGYPDLFVTNRTYYSMGKLAGIEQKNELLINNGGTNN